MRLASHWAARTSRTPLSSPGTPGGGKDQQVTGEEALHGHQHHLGQRGAVGGEDLVKLHLAPGAEGLVGVVDGDLPEQAAPRENQAGQHRAAHIPQAH